MVRPPLTLPAALLCCALAAQQEPPTREVGVMAARRPVSAPLRQGDAEQYSFGSYHALLIGIQRYQGHEADLRTAHEDVRQLARVLEQDYGFAPPRLLLDAEATQAGILAALDRLSGELDQRDSLLVFFAGHGTKAWSGTSWEEGFWVPYLPPGVEHRWWNWLSAQTLNRATARIRAQHVLLVSDSCYAGALTRDVQVQQSALPEWIRIQHERSSSHILTSGADEPVADDGRDGHSIFAWHLLDALRHNRDRFLPAASLAHHVVGAVMRDADYHRGRRSQQPVFARHPLDPRSDGQFVFVRTGEAAATAATAVPGAPPGYRFPNHVEVEAVAGGTFRYWSIEGGSRVEMILVPGGTLRRDSQAIVIEPFLIDRFEVTNERFDRFIDATGTQIGLRAAPRLLADQAPATGMNLAEARAFALWAGSKRLPTADEWEMAAAFDSRQQRTTTFPWGDAPLDQELPQRLHADRVGTFARDRSHCGVEGMGGSVRELCEVDAASRDAAAPRGVVRGGTQAERYRKVDPAVTYALAVDASMRQEAVVGFRCAKPLVPPWRGR